jgi:hypothetical protein
MKYLSIDLSSIGGAGLTHQSVNLHTLIKFCYVNDYKLIIPIFTLTGLHNNNKTIYTNFSDYYDFNNLLVDGNYYEVITNSENIDPVCIKHIVKKKYPGGLLANDDMFKDIPWRLISLPYVQSILNVSKSIVTRLGNFTCVHVRRGDVITNEQIDNDTRPKNILEKIKKYANNVVYIMTNEIPEFFNELKREGDYTFYLYSDFDELVNIKEQDNYKLFCIENEINCHANIRISTFNTPLTNKYSDYLSNAKGWQ